jgi:EAL domain-containing protein (putative c-di-GMP-specific phosphodiesterase class I)/ActR/RegA family two-component response regulator
MSAERESQLVLLLDDDAVITEALALGLEREGRTIITCNDVESAELIVERMQPSHIIADIRLSGPFAYEGLDFIRHAKEHAPESRIILISGEGGEALQLEASERGAVAFLQKPFDVGELDGMLDLLTCSVLSSAGDYGSLIRMPMLEDILESGDLNPFFQPIVRLDNASSILGFEALARLRSSSPLRNPDVLFLYAERKKRLADLEFACMRQALRAATSLPAGALIFLNVHPGCFDGRDTMREVLVSESEATGIPLDRIVLEITEQGSLTGSPAVLGAIADLRRLGIRFAFDDIGVAYSHLPLIDAVRPSFLKISQHFGSRFEEDSTKMKIVMNLHSLANDFNCDLILEGIEHESTAAVAAGLGIPFGQGFYFRTPADASAFSS